MQIVYHHLDTVVSTISWTEKHYGSFDRKALTVVSAEQQTAGRGRLPGREWKASKGKGLTVTAALFLERLCSDLPRVTQALCVELCDLIAQQGITPQIKWPNDVLIQGKKIAGIMADTKAIEQGYLLLLSFGMNINDEEESFREIEQPATSLYLETGSYFDRKALLEQICHRLAIVIPNYLDNGFDALDSRVAFYRFT